MSPNKNSYGFFDFPDVDKQKNMSGTLNYKIVKLHKAEDQFIRLTYRSFVCKGFTMSASPFGNLAV